MTDGNRLGFDRRGGVFGGKEPQEALDKLPLDSEQKTNLEWLVLTFGEGNSEVITSNGKTPSIEDIEAIWGDGVFFSQNVRSLINTQCGDEKMSFPEEKTVVNVVGLSAQPDALGFDESIDFATLGEVMAIVNDAKQKNQFGELIRQITNGQEDQVAMLYARMNGFRCYLSIALGQDEGTPMIGIEDSIWGNRNIAAKISTNNLLFFSGQGQEIQNF